MKSDAPCRSAVFRRSAMAALCLVIVHTAACAQTLPARTSPASERSAMPATTTRIDADGVAMTPAIAYGKLGRKYRYYVSQPLQVGRGKALGAVSLTLTCLH